MGELIEKKEVKKKIPPMQISQEPLFQHITYWLSALIPLGMTLAAL